MLCLMNWINAVGYKIKDLDWGLGVWKYGMYTYMYYCEEKKRYINVFLGQYGPWDSLYNNVCVLDHLSSSYNEIYKYD